MGGASVKPESNPKTEKLPDVPLFARAESLQVFENGYRRSETVRERDVVNGLDHWCKCWNEKGVLYMMKNMAVDRKIAAGTVKNEVEMLRNLDHPNIISLHDYYQSPRWHRLILDFTYENYIGRIRRGKYINKKDQALVFLQTVLAVSYLHNMQIMHGALSIENIRFVHKKSQAPEIKLTGFGHAIYAPRPIEILNPNLVYASPEMVKVGGSCHFPSEWWAMGIILFQIVYGRFPFAGEPKSGLYFLNARQGNIDFPETFSDVFDESLRELISKLLLTDPKHRGNDSHIMTSKWMVHYTSLDEWKDHDDIFLEDERRRCPNDYTVTPPPAPPSSDSEEAYTDEEYSFLAPSTSACCNASARSSAIHE